jgi:hypothetical protein
MARRLSAVLAIWLLAGATCGSNDEREFVCEEAHAHLKTCCPGLVVDENWCTFTFDCVDRDPPLETDDSRCVLAADCARIRAEGMCERAAQRGPRPSGRTSSAAPIAVCRAHTD